MISRGRAAGRAPDLSPATGKTLMSQTPTSPQTTPPTSTLHLADEFLARQTPMQRVRNVLYRYPAISPAIVLLVAVIVFGVINPRFLAPANLSLITQQVAVIGTLGVAQTLVILTAGIDLSVGAAMILSSVVMGNAAAGLGIPGPLALVIGLIAGVLTGLVNGLLVTRLTCRRSS